MGHDASPVDEHLMHSEEEVEPMTRAGRNSVRGATMALSAAALLLAGVLCGTTLALVAPQAALGLVAIQSEQAKPIKKAAEEDKEAPPPCKSQHADDTPSLFCWAVMFEDDKALIQSQFTGRAGIFACNDNLVIGQEEVSFGKDDCGTERKSVQKDLPSVKKGMYGVDGSMTSSWLNVPIFLACWDVIIASNEVWEHDFTVKVDPDTVFFPGRLGYHLKEHVGKPIYTTDCRYWGGDPVGKVFGSLEVLSKQAVGAYKNNMQQCKDLPWQGWGEDYWLQHCMNAIGVGPPVLLADWVADTTCPMGGNPDCGNKDLIANHPHKDAGDWWSCWKASQ